MGIAALHPSCELNFNVKTDSHVTPQEYAHFRILKIISGEPQVSQRELADRLEISVGKVNYLVKALAGKGLIKLENFQHTQGVKAKLKKVTYLLTPKGILERISLTRDYLVRMEEEYEALKAEVAEIDREKASGLATGRSDK